MQAYHAILVPLDGSALSEQVLPLALGIARRSGLCVYLARVLGVESGLGSADDERIQHERARAASDLDALAKRLRDETHVPIVTALLDKHDDVSQAVAATLYCFAQAVGIDLIVMATHGHGGLTRLWLGSVADSLLHIATMPLLLVRPHLLAAPVGQPFEHILIPLDGGPLAEQAIAPALALGTSGQTTFTLLEIISPLLAEHTVPPYSVGLPQADAAALEASAQAYLARVVAQHAPHENQFRTQVSVAEPADAILAAAQQSDLIAMATHGRGVLARTLLGSVADRVVRNADVPVLVYRPAVTPWPHPADLSADARMAQAAFASG